MITLHCQCKDEGGSRCGLAVATVQNGVLLITSRHHGEKHVTPITLADLQRLMEQDKERRDPALTPA